jgi:hypothetical protein
VIQLDHSCTSDKITGSFLLTIYSSSGSARATAVPGLLGRGFTGAGFHANGSCGEPGG